MIVYSESPAAYEQVVLINRADCAGGFVYSDPDLAEVWSPMVQHAIKDMHQLNDEITALGPAICKAFWSREVQLHESDVREWIRATVVQRERAKRHGVRGAAQKSYLTALRRRQFDSVRAAAQLALIERDGALCANCFTTEALTVDHITPLSRGGSDELENLQLLCRRCNAQKGDRNVRA